MALASVDEKTPLHQLAGKLCNPIKRQGRRYRALNPWSLGMGLCSKPLTGRIRYQWIAQSRSPSSPVPDQGSDKQQRRRSARVSRWLALLRAHGILRKVPGSHRYHLTSKGRTLVTALLSAREANTEQLTKLAA